jgi:hypothetical protein
VDVSSRRNGDPAQQIDMEGSSQTVKGFHPLLKAEPTCHSIPFTTLTPDGVIRFRDGEIGLPPEPGSRTALWF